MNSQGPGGVGNGLGLALPAERTTLEHLGASPGSCEPRRRRAGLLRRRALGPAGQSVWNAGTRAHEEIPPLSSPSLPTT